MHLKHINLVNFKNISQASLDLSPGINCFVGENGSGKTNMLDAIYYLSFCKSYFNPVDSQNIKHDEAFFVIQGEYELRGEKEEIYCGLKRNQKKQFKRNKKEYTKLSEHIGLLPLVIISPSDEQLITEGSEQRRKYIDSVISQYDRVYLDRVIRYNRVILQRNTLLKQIREKGNGESMLDVWDIQLNELGRKIYEQRKDFINELEPVYNKFQNYISGGKESVTLKYRSHMNDGDYTEQLLGSRQKDIILGYTTKGIHKDDIDMQIEGFPIKKVASQGQKKTFLIALKLAQFEFLAKHSGVKPVLLLDDIFDKLDDLRGGKLIDLVAEKHFKQIFITDTRLEHLDNLLKRVDKDSKIIKVVKGEFTVFE
ncbi:MAG: DNA replication/repair protein RecF [Chlorobi bacterium]|nr:DNA replication/repair protein RecF [Chlorobiota bacterium]